MKIIHNSHRGISLMRLLLLYIMLFTLHTAGNPVIPFLAYPMTSELQYIDSANWTIELDINKYYNFNRELKLTLPCSTDVFWIDTGRGAPQPVPVNVWINTDGVTCITNEHFPEVIIKDHFFVYCSGVEAGNRGQQQGVGGRHKPTQSLATDYLVYNDPFSLGGRATAFYLIKDNTPTLGYENDGTNMTSTVIGTVVDSFGTPIPEVYCEYYKYSMGFGPSSIVKTNPSIHKTDLSGQFTIESYIPYPQSSLAFTNTADIISKLSFGPLTVEPDSTLNFTARLTDYHQTGIINEPTPDGKTGLEILMITQPDVKNVSIIFANTAYSREDFNIDIYSVKGVLVNTLSVKTRGEGTYTVLWNRKSSSGAIVPSGTYMVTVKGVNGSVSEKITLL